MSNQDYVILVDENDNEIGVEKKLLAHQSAKLHRAFSVFVMRPHNNHWQLLLQQRQKNKYHSAGLWTNTCCSHPAPGESILSAAHRRLAEEMGITVTLREIGCFHYRAEVGLGLIEHEFDHVLLGISDHDPVINQAEVADYCWMNIADLKDDLNKNPQKYTAWFPQALELVLPELEGWS